MPRLPHIVNPSQPDSLKYTTPVRGGSEGTFPPRERQSHGQRLRAAFEEAWNNSNEEKIAYHSERNGVYLEFKSEPGYELALRSLEDMRTKRVRLLNVRTVKEEVIENDDRESREVMYATVYVPDEQRAYFANKITEYLEENTKKGNAKNRPLIETLSNIRKALLVESFWVDDPDLIPAQGKQWVEVWLRAGPNGEEQSRLEEVLEDVKIERKSGLLSFPERVVCVVRANRDDLERITANIEYVAEYRLAKTTADFFMDLPNYEQVEWGEDLLDRLVINNDSGSSVCVLDTGVNNGHQLLQPVINDEHCQSVDSAWGTHDHHGHGTQMAGVITYGNLIDCLQSTEQIVLSHSVESVKILPPGGQRNNQELWGYVTSQAASLATIQAPDRNRSFCLAVNASDTRDKGRPSSWSATIDNLSYGIDDDSQCLFIISAGNVINMDAAAINYPEEQETDSIHDPAQSWNAITVGGYTELDVLNAPTLNGYSTVASAGQLSPFTTTSTLWEDKWPIKPELVLESGNLAVDQAGFHTETDELMLLSTYHDPAVSTFYPFGMTSAASAQLAHMAGKIQAKYPNFWPETVRALLVHSAEWPVALKEQFVPNIPSKAQIKKLMRICGYGVPNLEKALYSAENSLTLISQSNLQPYTKENNSYKTNDMHLYELPWPSDLLLDLPTDTEVEMRVTLSYFIEPGPGEVGWKDRYRYASHGLRFDLNSPGESKEEFCGRVNRRVREGDFEDNYEGRSSSDHWVIGQARNKGSIHSDIWQGSSQDLATSKYLSVSPVVGWWRERNHLDRWDSNARYALVVTISTTDEQVDVYTPIAAELNIPVEIVTEI